MDRRTLLAYIAVGLLLAAAVVLDLLVYPGYSLAALYAVPLLVSALTLPSRTVLILAAIVLPLGALEMLRGASVMDVRLVRFLGLGVTVYFAIRLAAERERGQRSAAESEESGRRTTDILESITDAFFALDQDWRFSYVNSEAERLLRKRRAELIGRVVWEEFPEAVDSAFWQQYHRAVSEGVTVAFEEFYPPLGRWFDVRGYPSRSGLSVYFRDTTERRQAEKEREGLLGEVERRSAELERLQQQRAKHVLGISHGLRTPLTVIQGQAQLLLRVLDREGQDDRLRRWAAAISSSAQRMSLTLRDLVDLTSLESGQPLMLNRVPVEHDWRRSSRRAAHTNGCGPAARGPRGGADAHGLPALPAGGSPAPRLNMPGTAIETNSPGIYLYLSGEAVP